MFLFDKNKIKNKNFSSLWRLVYKSPGPTQLTNTKRRMSETRVFGTRVGRCGIWWKWRGRDFRKRRQFDGWTTSGYKSESRVTGRIHVVGSNFPRDELRSRSQCRRRRRLTSRAGPKISFLVYTAGVNNETVCPKRMDRATRLRRCTTSRAHDIHSATVSSKYGQI